MDLLHVAWVAMIVMILANYAGFARWYLFRDEGGVFLVYLFFSLIAAGALYISQSNNAITLMIMLFMAVQSAVIGSITWREGKVSITEVLFLDELCAIVTIFALSAIGL